MVKIFGNWGRIRNYVSKRVRIPICNTFVGRDAGKVTTGILNDYHGYHTGIANTTGERNSFFGSYTGASNTTGERNKFFGSQTGFLNTIGCNNSFFGYQTGYYNAVGCNNSFFGYQTGFLNTIGCNNSFFGYQAGYYETGSYKLFIDTLKHANEADARIKALIYGVFNAVTTNQLLRINGILELTEIKTGATQALAGAAVNEIWKTTAHATLPDNVLMVGV